LAAVAVAVAAAGPEAAAPSLICANSASVLTVAPSAATISANVPATGLGTFNGDLVSFQLTEHIVHGNLIARFFEPGRDSGLGHRFAQSGNTNFGGHDFILST
jgi:hypothetical protein